MQKEEFEETTLPRQNPRLETKTLHLIKSPRFSLVYHLHPTYTAGAAPTYTSPTVTSLVKTPIQQLRY